VSQRVRTGRSEARRLADLEGIGKVMLADLALLEVHDVGTLAKQDPGLLYERLCARTGTRQDPCVLDVFSCAVAQARDPGLPAAQRKWWWWSRQRKARAPARRRRVR
jgi:hypothetical protein